MNGSYLAAFTPKLFSRPTEYPAMVLAGIHPMFAHMNKQGVITGCPGLVGITKQTFRLQDSTSWTAQDVELRATYQLHTWRRVEWMIRADQS